MKLSAEELAQLVGYIELAREFKPVAVQAVDVLFEYAPEIRRLVSSVSDGVVDMTVRAINRYMDQGFTKEEAMYLTTMNKDNLREGMSREWRGK